MSNQGKKLPNNPLNKLGIVNMTKPDSLLGNNFSPNLPIIGSPQMSKPVAPVQQAPQTQAPQLQSKAPAINIAPTPYRQTEYFPENMFGGATPVYDINKIIQKPSTWRNEDNTIEYSTKSGVATTIKPVFDVQAPEANIQDQWNRSKDNAWDDLMKDINKYVAENKPLTENEVASFYPEYADQVSVVMELQNDIINNQNQNLGLTDQQFREAYPELLGKSHAELNPTRVAPTQEAFDNLQKKWDDLLNNVDIEKFERLSESAQTEYLLAQKSKQIADEVREEFAVDKGITDYQIIQTLKDMDPEFMEEQLDLEKRAWDQTHSQEDKKIMRGEKTWRDAGKMGERWKREVSDYVIREGEDKSNFLSRASDAMIGGILTNLDKMLGGIQGLADRARATEYAVLDELFLGKEFDPKKYRESNRNMVEDLASLTAGSVGTFFTMLAPGFMGTLTAVGETEAGEKVMQYTFGLVPSALNWMGENVPGIKRLYNKLDDQGKEDVVGAISMGIYALLFRSVKNTKPVRTMQAGMAEIHNMVRNSLNTGKASGVIQSMMERGLASYKDGKVQLDWANRKGGDYLWNVEGGMLRTANRAVEGFMTAMDAQLEGFGSRVNMRAEAMKPQAPANSIGDKRTWTEKASSKVGDVVGQAKDVVGQAREATQSSFDSVIGAVSKAKNSKTVKTMESGLSSLGKNTKTSVSNKTTSLKDLISNKMSGLDKGTIKRVQDNPYVKDLWNEAVQSVEDTGLPMEASIIRNEPLKKLGEDLLGAIEARENNLQNTSPLYGEMRGIKDTYSLQEAIDPINKILDKYDIGATEDGLDFSKSQFLDSDARAINRAMNMLLDLEGEMTPGEYLNLRTKISKLGGYDKGVSNDGSSVVRQIRHAMDQVAKSKIPGLKEIDGLFSKQLNELKEIKDGLFYREKVRKGQLRDNFYSILKNILSENRANMRARLEEIMPDLEARAEAINMLPKLLNAHNRSSKIVDTIVKSSLGMVGGAIGGFTMGAGGAVSVAILGSIAGAGVANWTKGIRKQGIDKIMNIVTPENKAKLQEIQRKIDAKKDLTDAEKAIVQEIRNRINEIKKEYPALPSPETVGKGGTEGPEIKEIAKKDGDSTSSLSSIKPKKTGQTKKSDYTDKNLSSNQPKDESKGSERVSGEKVGGDHGGLSAIKGSSSIQRSGGGQKPSDQSNTSKEGGARGDINANGVGSGRGNKSSQRVNNQKAKEILESKNFSINQKDYTPEELEIFRNYEGAGGLTKKGEDTTGVLDQFYTPNLIVEKMRDLAIGAFEGEIQSTLEPTTGTGRFITLAPKTTKVAGYEIDKVPGTIAQILHPDATIKVMDFQDLFMDFTGKNPQKYTGELYDVVIGNPPYKDRITPQRKLGEEPKINRFEDYFIKRGIDLLKENGVLAMIVPSSFLSKGMNHAKTEISKNAKLIDAYRLPEGVFPNTNVATDIVIFRKEAGGNVEDLVDAKRFENNPSKVLGEVKTRFNRFGKEENYVEGTIENIKSGIKSDPKQAIQEKVNLASEKAELGKIQNKNFEEFTVSNDKEAGLKVAKSPKGKEALEEMTGIKLDDNPENQKAIVENYKPKSEYSPKQEEIVLDPAIGADTQIQDAISGINKNQTAVLEKVERIRGNEKNIYSINDKRVFNAELIQDKNGDYNLHYNFRNNLSKVGGKQKYYYPVKYANIRYRENSGLSSISKPKEDNPYTEVKDTAKKEEGLSSLAKKETTPKKKRTKSKKNPDESITIIKGDKTDIETKVIGSKEMSNEMKLYQMKTDINGYVIDVEASSDTKNLNYIDGKTQTNELYFSGDIYEKLAQLEIDKGKISKEMYDKQKAGLESVKPEVYAIDDITFDPNNISVLEMETDIIVEKQHGRETINKKATVLEMFYKYIDELPGGGRTRKRDMRHYLGGSKLKKEDKNAIMEDTKYHLNRFMRENLDKETVDKIVDIYNKTYRSYVKPDNASIPLYIKDISKTFRGRNLTIMPNQIEGINFLLSKGSGIVAHGVGHGKTMEGIIATMTAMERGWTKRPLFIVPGPTMYDTWVGTIKELYPTKEIINLGSLTVGDIARLRKDLGPDPRNWIKDGQIAIIKHSGFNGKIDFMTKTKELLSADLMDVMATDEMTTRQEGAFKEKLNTIVETVTRGHSGTKGSQMYNFSGDFLRGWYDKLERYSYEDFKTEFIKEARANAESKGIEGAIDFELAVDQLWGLKPIFIEDLGIDHLTVDEAHNYKNIFEKAKMEEDINGEKGINRFGEIVGSSSGAGRKMFMGTQYIQRKNNNRNVYLLTATPFNNQPMEVYNMLSLVGRARLKELGIFNVNTFFSLFANFKEDFVVGGGGTSFEYKMVMKSFENVQELQRLINEFVDYKGDSASLIKPLKKLEKVVLEMSPIQKEVQKKLEAIIEAKKEKGDIIMGLGQMRLNLISPYITKYYEGSNPTMKEFIENSPKLKFATDVVREIRAMGKTDGIFIYVPNGTAYHELFRQGIAEMANIPIEKIGIINGKISPDKKDSIAEKYRSGEINVLIGGGNTVEGIDLQNNGFITINTLMGWNPTERVQLNGRQWRQGNLRSNVVEVLPLLENSADIVMFQKAEEKESRINNIFEYQGRVFNTEEIDAQEEKLALLTDPRKKAEVWFNLELKKLSVEKDQLLLTEGDLKKVIDTEKEVDQLEEYQGMLAKAKEEGLDYKIKIYKERVDDLKKKQKRVEQKKEKLELDDVKGKYEEVGRRIKDIEEQMEVLSDEIPNITKKFEVEAMEQLKNRGSYQDYLDKIKNNAKDLKYFKDKEEQKQRLDQQRGLSSLS